MSQWQSATKPICFGLQILAVGFNLVPSKDIPEGSENVVANDGACRLHTANGQVEAPYKVQLSVPEVGLTDVFATILKDTPRVLTVGGLCIDEQADFVRWDHRA